MQLVFEEEEWEIKRFLGKRRAGNGYEYKAVLGSRGVKALFIAANRYCDICCKA